MSRSLVGGNLGVLGAIRREALIAGCSYMRLMSQADGASEELNRIMKEEGRGGGLCRSMSIRWIRGRAGGTDFLNQLLPPGRPVNDALVKEMAKEYDDLGRLDIVQQVKYITEQVRAGMEGSIISQGNPISEYTYAVKGGVAAWFLDSSQGELRSINCTGYPHAMAVDTRETYCVFYDPNWGEFTFPTREKFLSFLNKSIFVGKKYCDVKEMGMLVRAGFKTPPQWDAIQTRRRR